MRKGFEKGGCPLYREEVGVMHVHAHTLLTYIHTFLKSSASVQHIILLLTKSSFIYHLLHNTVFLNFFLPQRFNSIVLANGV